MGPFCENVAPDLQTTELICFSPLAQMRSPTASVAMVTSWWTGLTRLRANPTSHPKVTAEQICFPYRHQSQHQQTSHQVEWRVTGLQRIQFPEFLAPAGWAGRPLLIYSRGAVAVRLPALLANAHGNLSVNAASSLSVMSRQVIGAAPPITWLSRQFS